MSAEPLLPHYTVDDYQHWKGDWELWDGHAIAMSPSPFGRHQLLVSRLLVAISNAMNAAECNSQAIVELDWIVSNQTVVRPDVIVVCDQVPERHIELTPALVVEVLLESIRGNDLHFKRHLYEAEGVPIYLIVDPDAKSVICHQLNGQQYRATTHTEKVQIAVCDECHIEIDVTELFVK